MRVNFFFFLDPFPYLPIIPLNLKALFNATGILYPSFPFPLCVEAMG